ncbi:MAG: DegT/DnrJ/EryC1/StrS family aminotransferase [Flavobacteriaceae bacterium]
MIQFLDVQKINARFETKFKAAFSDFLNKGQCVLGPYLSAFELEFATYCGTRYCTGVASGLDAIELIFKGYLELGKLNEGDEVIVPANTYIASILGIINSGLKPVLVDVSEGNYNITTSDIEQYITPKTKAILVVHLYGELVEMKAITAFAKNENLLVVEDAAQAHGAMDDTKLTSGNLSDAAAFSFYPSKNLGALGDGGAITTNDLALNTVVNKLRNYGTSSKYINDLKGVNSRLDELQAAFLSIKLKELDADNERRRMIAKCYLKHINNAKIVLPQYDNSKSHVFHVFVIKSSKRDELQKYMLKNNIETVIHYPTPPHKQMALKEFSNLNFPNTELLHNEVLSLPISPVQSIEDTEHIVSIINQF